MGYKNIGVWADNKPDQAAFFARVAEFAALHGASVSAVHAVPEPPALAFDMFAVQVAALVEEYMSAMNEIQQSVKTDFENAMKAQDVAATWMSDDSHTLSQCISRLRYCDLVLFKQPDPDDAVAQARANRVLLETGRPVLIIPYFASGISANRVIVGWDESTQASRAVHDAMPLLVGADTVDVVSVEEADKDIPLGASVPMAEHLARHGVCANALRWPATEISPANMLLNHAADTGADLIVAGAWGHSRAGEYLFGGATRTLLSSMTVPVLFSH